MLIVTRKPGEGLRIGAAVTVRVLEISGGRVRLSVEAPPEVAVRRVEEQPEPAEKKPG